MRSTRTVSKLGLAVMTAMLLTPLAACREKGPAERAGEKIDDAKDKVEDALDPKGPAEKAGRAIDRATD